MSAGYLDDLFGLDGQMAVVIGGAGVLGGALCAGLVRAGAHVVVADLTEEGCQRRVRATQEARRPGQLLHRRRHLAGVARGPAGRRHSRSSGRVEILVNAAGVNAGSTFLEATEADWDRVMAINLKAVFQACQVFARHMVEAGGGAILNIGSVTSHLPLSRVFAYACSKAGVLNLTENVAHEFGKQGVRCNAICPGFFPAEQNRKLLDQERIDNIMRHTPMRRFGEPEELIGAALLLLSPKAGQFITGAVVNVDGGFTAAWF